MLDQLIHVPVLVKILTIFGLMLLFNRLRIPLSLCLLIASLVLLSWMKISLGLWGPIIISSLVDFQTITLIIIVDLILIMSKLMKETGHMDRFVDRFMRLAKDSRTVGSVMTALIGLLPMPGGALFSAPMVQTSLSMHQVTSEQKTALNYWFRHIWEFWWPLYPGVVLAITLTEVTTGQYITAMIPLTFFAVAVGYFFILRPIGKVQNVNGQGLSWAGIKSFLWEMMPILIVIIVIIFQTALTGILKWAGLAIEIPGAISIIPGLLIAILWVGLVNRISWPKFKSAILEKSMLPMMFLLVGIMLFKGVMIKTEAVGAIRNELVTFHIPGIFVILLMPFLSGMVTGIAVGFVGTSFPLIIPMFPAGHSFDYFLYIALAYTFGYMGMMLSPIHICFLVTKDYFKANLWRSYYYVGPSALTIMAGVLAFYGVTRLF